MNNFANTQISLINGTDTRTGYLSKNNRYSNSNEIGKAIDSKLVKRDAEQRPKFYLGSYVRTAK